MIYLGLSYYCQDIFYSLEYFGELPLNLDSHRHTTHYNMCTVQGKVSNENTVVDVSMKTALFEYTSFLTG